MVSPVSLTVASAWVTKNSKGVCSGFSCVVFPPVLDNNTGARSPTTHNVSSRTQIFNNSQLSTSMRKPLRLIRKIRPRPDVKALAIQWKTWGHLLRLKSNFSNYHLLIIETFWYYCQPQNFQRFKVSGLLSIKKYETNTEAHNNMFTAQVRRSGVRGLPGLHSQFYVNQDYILRPYHE